MFAILQKYDFSSKSQRKEIDNVIIGSCLRYCKSTIFQANHNYIPYSQIWHECCLRYCKSTIFQANHNHQFIAKFRDWVVCDTAKVRFFKQITTGISRVNWPRLLFAILQKYDFSSKSQLNVYRGGGVIRCLRYCKSTIFQANHNKFKACWEVFKVVCDTAKVRFFKQITTKVRYGQSSILLFAILQKYDFSSKSQPNEQNKKPKDVVCDTAKVRFFKQITTMGCRFWQISRCLRYCKSTIFQANHNACFGSAVGLMVVCDTAKVRFFKQITTILAITLLFKGCLRFCKSTIFQANHNRKYALSFGVWVVCDTAKVRFFKQITTAVMMLQGCSLLFAILQKYDFSSKSQLDSNDCPQIRVVCDTAKVRFFKQITTLPDGAVRLTELFAILQKYDFSSKSQQRAQAMQGKEGCLRYCKSTIFQANHNTIESNYSAIRRINYYWLSRSYTNRHMQIWVKNVILNLFATMLRL